MALIPGLTPLAGRKFTSVASLLVTAQVEVTIDAETFGQVDALVKHVASDIQAQMLRSFKAPKTGRWYTYTPNPFGPFQPGRRRSNKSRKYRASAPGEPPAIRSGTLSRMTGQGLTFPRTGEAELVIRTGYETFLELGTRRMAPRPYVFPAINEVLTKLQQSDVISAFTMPSRSEI